MMYHNFMKLLLHACCAPCLTGFIPGLNDEKIRPDLFWYNPNIHPVTEYNSRKESLIACAYEEKLELLTEDFYGLREFLEEAYNKNECWPEKRCPVCYRMRLEKTAAAARNGEYDAFSTTLLVSPHQNHDLIKKIGDECAADFGIDFFYRDFRLLFREGQRKARNKGRYMQKYCGCIFSEEERF